MSQTDKSFGLRLFVLILVAAALLMVWATGTLAATIFESGALGTTGVTFADLENGAVPGINVNSFIFPGVRFELVQPVVTSQIGGHFVERMPGTFFGAIVALDSANDFPDSNNLSTPDVLGTAILTFPNPSNEIFGDLVLPLDPGWYALVFGSGLFGANGLGGAVRNGIDIDVPPYIAYGPNLHWFDLDVLQTPFDNHRFVVKGSVAPEPSTLNMVFFVLAVLGSLPLRRA